MHALLTTPQTAPDLNWYLDSGATHHLTANLANLYVKADEYHGPNQILIGNGLGLTVKHIGSTHLSTPTSSFLLNDVLHVPHIIKNLISVDKFTIDTNTLIEFLPTHFIVKDRTMGKVLLHELSKMDCICFLLLSIKFLRRLLLLLVNILLQINGIHTLDILLLELFVMSSRFSLPFSSNKTVYSCSACFSSKSKKLHFALSCT